MSLVPFEQCHDNTRANDNILSDTTDETHDNTSAVSKVKAFRIIEANINSLKGKKEELL